MAFNYDTPTDPVPLKIREHQRAWMGRLSHCVVGSTLIAKISVEENFHYWNGDIYRNEILYVKSDQDNVEILNGCGYSYGNLYSEVTEILLPYLKKLQCYPVAHVWGSWPKQHPSFKSRIWIVVYMELDLEIFGQDAELIKSELNVEVPDCDLPGITSFTLENQKFRAENNAHLCLLNKICHRRYPANKKYITVTVDSISSPYMRVINHDMWHIARPYLQYGLVPSDELKDTPVKIGDEILVDYRGYGIKFEGGSAKLEWLGFPVFTISKPETLCDQVRAFGYPSTKPIHPCNTVR
jgi:hypothetical protein